MTAPANGHAPACSRVPLVPLLSGPASPWPPAAGTPPDSVPVTQPDTAPAVLPDTAADTTVTVPGGAQRRPVRALATAAATWRTPDGDRLISWSTSLAVTAVATFAAIVSYSHIYFLAIHHGQDGIAARLLPLSVDGVIAEASLVMLYAARKHLRAYWLARLMLWLGIGATVAANAAVALPAAWISPVTSAVIGALLSAWPAGAFIGSVEMAMRFVRDSRTLAASKDTAPDTGTDSEADNPAVTEPAGRAAALDHLADPVAAGAARSRPPKPPSRGQRPPAVPDKVKDTVRRHPDWDDKRVADVCGVSPRTVRRRRADMTRPEGGR